MRKNILMIGLVLLFVLILVPVITILLQHQGKQETATPPTPGVPIKRASPTPTAGGQGIDISPVPNGKVYYVSPDGSDKNNGSQQNPFATIQKAAQVVKPGTTVNVLPGTYTQPVTITKSGTANARILFRSTTKWGAKIATKGHKDPWTTHANYIDIVDFDVTATQSRDGIENQGSFIRTIGNHVHDIAGGCDSIGGSGIDDSNYSAHDDDIIGNVVDHIGSTYPKLCEYVHAIYHSTARGHIQNNIVYDNAGCGINLWHAATETVVTNNLTFGNKEHGISLGTNTDNTNDVPGDHFLVANNISIDNALLGIRERRGVGPHNQYLNNIVYGNGDKPFGDEQYNWPSAAGNQDEGTIKRDAQFVQFNDDGTGDYHLTKSSPAINAGVKLDAPTFDFENNPRPQNTGVDIGPYTYGSMQGSIFGSASLK